ncbi:hypothetical protein PHET_05120 [Paragonimus heterotremus]|uniref:Nonsense-mediated mRNA decay factor SMG8 n=1 Tax=Paragonimus heterotremus TaxID=100268 RepID=A0A8J4T120_9TREM|nr:hypothetical protein PHET_05120 [Paragonimus heterotremus]
MLSGQHYCDGCFTVPPRFDFKVLPLKGRKITVISLIGECDTIFGNRQCHNVEGYPVEEFLSQVSPGTYIDGYYDCQRQIVYLMFHPMKLEEIVHYIRDEKLKMDDMLSMNDYINLKLLYYLFIVSHFVVVFSVGSGLDPNYIRVFKLIDKMRAKMRHTLDGYLRTLPLPRDWLNAGRASIPKLLFVFKLLPNVARKICTTPDAVRDLEQNLVTQIFNTFYETGITSNNPANQLFILPGHNFVHVLLGNEYPNGIGQKPVMHDDLAQEYFELILDNLNMNHLSSAQETKRSKSIKASFSERNSAVPPPTPWDFPPPDQPEEHSLAAFLHLHVTAMLDQTVSRTVGFGQVPLAYELPTCKAWFMACYKLYTSLMPEDTLNTELNSDLIPDMADGASSTPSSLAEAWHRSLGTLISTSAVRSSGLTDPFSQELTIAKNKGNPSCGWIQSHPTDPLYRLSELRCRAAMTAAEAHYKQDLPIHYSNTYHVVKVVSAFNVLISLARGRLVFQALMQLSKRLAHLYLAGRVTCSALSLTGHPCQHELHRVPDEAANLRALLASLPSGGETKTDGGNREGFFSSRLSATEREVKAGLENMLPSGLTGKWRAYWLESFLTDHVPTTPPLPQSGRMNSQLEVADSTASEECTDNQADEHHLTVIPHRSDTVLVSACNCGRQQAERADPFDWKEANWRFYFMLSNVCCNKLTHIPLAPQFLCEPGHPFVLPGDPQLRQLGSSPTQYRLIDAGDGDVNSTRDVTAPVAVLTRRVAALGVSSAADVVRSDGALSPRELLLDQPDPLDTGLSQPLMNDIMLLSSSSQVTGFELRQTTEQQRSHHSDGRNFEVEVEDLSETEILASQSSTIESSSSSSGQLLGEGVDEEDTENPLIGRRRVPTRQDTTRSKTTSPRTVVNTSEPNAPVMCTVRFRDGVPASNWQTGDIPRFPSWSIYALGKYFSYSHSSGLSCCGFLRSSNFLLPWDVTINPSAWASNERAGRATKGGARGGKYRGGKSDVDTVKLFIGFEMECPMGHRFFLAGPDRPMDGPMQSSQVRRAVHGLLTRDLPLYIPCRCQNSQIRGGSGGLYRAASSAGEWSTYAPTSDGRPVIWAQLSRIYLAIPAAPIQVRLQPRVRPGPSKITPIFHLGHTLDQCNEGLLDDKFSDSDQNSSTDDESDVLDADGLTDSRTLEYHKPLFHVTSSGTANSKQHPGFILLDNGYLWVVRLPFAYHDGTQLFTRPTTPDAIKEWRLLKGCIKLQV